MVGDFNGFDDGISLESGSVFNDVADIVWTSRQFDPVR
jgi:hypothetical protein